MSLKRERQAKTPYERVSDAYARHINDCIRCGSYHGPPYESCESGGRILKRMAGFWESSLHERMESDD